MPRRYVVAPGVDGHTPEFVYPADPNSFRLIKNAGGLTKMTEKERAGLKFKTVHAGDDCSDMPQPALGIYLERGWVIVVDDTLPPPPSDAQKDEVKG